MPNPDILTYCPTVQDVRRAMEEHGREVSLTKLQIALVPTAQANGFHFVDWPMMKRVVEGMLRSGWIIEIPQPQGFSRFILKEMWDGKPIIKYPKKKFRSNRNVFGGSGFINQDLVDEAVRIAQERKKNE